MEYSTSSNGYYAACGHTLPISWSYLRYSVFFFNDAATTEIYTLSLHDALPIWHDAGHSQAARICRLDLQSEWAFDVEGLGDRKSTRLNSSHVEISYAVFCLKKKRWCPHASRETAACRGRRPSWPGAASPRSLCL